MGQNPLDALFEWEKFSIQEKIEKRQEYNRLLLKMVSDKIEEMPQLRFGQILCNLFPQLQSEGFFYEEPCDTYFKDKLRGINLTQMFNELMKDNGKSN